MKESLWGKCERKTMGEMTKQGLCAGICRREYFYRLRQQKPAIELTEREYDFNTRFTRRFASPQCEYHQFRNRSVAISSRPEASLSDIYVDLVLKQDVM